jgi:hypothetical protein
VSVWATRDIAWLLFGLAPRIDPAQVLRDHEDL